MGNTVSFKDLMDTCGKCDSCDKKPQDEGEDISKVMDTEIINKNKSTEDLKK